jgi:hypothetical protein
MRSVANNPNIIHSSVQYSTVHAVIDGALHYAPTVDYFLLKRRRKMQHQGFAAKRTVLN